MAIPMTEYISNQSTVYAGEITTLNIGETIQELYDNGANYIALNTYEVNPLNQTDDSVHTGLIVSIHRTMYTVVFGDMLVEEETEFGTVIFPMKKDVFNKVYTSV